MMIKIRERVRGKEAFLLFMAVGALAGLATGLHDTVFNNYLNDTFHISEVARGALEFPRELPGMLVALISGLLCFLPDTRLGAFAMILAALGALGLAFFSPVFGVMAFWMFINSAGGHLYMPVATSVGVSLAEKGAVGKRLGQLQGVNTAAMLLASLIIWVGFTRLNLSYSNVFALGALAAIGAAVLLFKIKPQRKERAKVRIFLKKKYTLYYVLNVLFGTRKQVFLTFGPWVLIKIFGQSPATFAALALVGNVAGVFIKPLIGRAIDRFGERRVITAESVMLVFVCLGYGFAEKLGLGQHAVYLVFLCYMMDQWLYAVKMSHSTYLYKIADTPDDLTPTLAMGVSIDHLFSMIIPILGGWLWAQAGYEYVFVAAAVVALLNFVAARFIGREPFRKAELQSGQELGV
jgi:predicted MFS family arabinose efflux permease